MALWKRKRPGDRPDDWERDERADQPEDDPFGPRDDLFRDFDDEFRRMRGYMNSMMEKMAQGELRSPEEGGPYVYGWSMRVGPDGVPKIQTFGNVNPAMRSGRTALPGRSQETPVEEGSCPASSGGPGVREPLTDVCSDEKTITVTAEMPGIEKGDIDLETGEDFLVIKVERGSRRYYKELELPGKVASGSAKAKYNNGVLEITLERTGEERKGTKVQID